MNEINEMIAKFMGEPIMIWNDPAPIEGNDYRVTMFKPSEDLETAVIHYGVSSEAEVYLSELEDIEFNYNTCWNSLMLVIDRLNHTDYENYIRIEDLYTYLTTNEINGAYAIVVRSIKEINKNASYDR